MKSKTFKRLALPLLLIATIGLISCGEKEKYPKEIPFTEYSLTETGCWWTNIAPNKVIVINSMEELKNYIECNTDVSYPEIDFSKNSLLLVLVTDVTDCNIDSPVEKLLLKQLSASNYELSIEINPSFTANAAPFFRYIAVITEKLDGKSDVELNVTTIKI